MCYDKCRGADEPSVRGGKGGPIVFKRIGALLMAMGCASSAPCALAETGPTKLTTIRVASGLSNPVFVTHAPGDLERLFIIEQRARIRILRNGTVLPTAFLDIGTLVSGGSEQGLLGLAFHPDYENNRQFYINYTNSAGNTVVAMYTASADPDLANPNGDVILTFGQPFSNHNGGWMGFGPDGYLYIASGDGGDREDPFGNGQSIVGDLLGCILRIDVNGDDFPADANRDYAIPPDNPFVGLPGEDEIWAYGLRNPWRCAFDSVTGDLWIADVGQADWEEINVQPSTSRGGENYGWSCFEGNHCMSFGGCDCTALSGVSPIHEYSHGGTPNRCSITGGEVYRGCAIPELAGTYFFADYCSGQIWSLRRDGEVVTVVDRTEELAPIAPLDLRLISSFGTDAQGEIYLCDRGNGEVFKIVPVGGTATRIVDSDPPGGAIDARTPTAADGNSAEGWREVSIGFDGPAGCLLADEFTVVQEGGSGEAPSLVGLEAIGPSRLRMRLDRPISPLAWTTIRHEASGTQVRLGYLPGDVNADKTSVPSDILDLIDSLNGLPPVRSIWSTDIDRSGETTPADILELIDLLTGAIGSTAFNGARLP